MIGNFTDTNSMLGNEFYTLDELRRIEILHNNRVLSDYDMVKLIRTAIYLHQRVYETMFRIRFMDGALLMNAVGNPLYYESLDDARKAAEQFLEGQSQSMMEIVCGNNVIEIVHK